MAYANTSYYSSNNHWSQIVADGLTSVVARNTDLMQMLPKKVQIGGDAAEWRVNTSGNTSAEVGFSEGAAQPAAVAQEIVKASVSFVDARVMIRVGGRLRRAIRGMALKERFNVIQENFGRSAEDLADAVEQALCGATNSGILLAADSTGAFAGLSKSTYPALASYENAGSADYDEIDTLRTTLWDTPRNGRMSHILVDGTEEQVIAGIIGDAGAANSGIRVDFTQNGGELNLAPKKGGTYFGEAHVKLIRHMAADTAVGIDIRDFTLVDHVGGENLGAGELGLEIRPAALGDDDNYQLLCSYALCVKNTRRQGKITSF